jgi:uncharacterized protein (TIGR00251 family)
LVRTAESRLTLVASGSGKKTRPCYTTVVGDAIREAAGAVEVDVSVVPRASRSQVVGTLGDRIKVQLAAPPVDGAANAELVALLADLIGVPARSIAIVRGATHKRKTVRISGVDAATIRGLIEQAAAR